MISLGNLIPNFYLCEINIKSMMSADMYIDASVYDKRKNGKCAVVILVGDDDEFLWTKSITFEELLTQFPKESCNVGKYNIGSSAYETYSLLGFTQFLVDKHITDINFTCYTDNLPLFDVFNKIGQFKKITKKIYEALFVNINILKRYNVTFDVRWVNGHNNIYGNERADMYTRSKIKKKQRRNFNFPIQSIDSFI